MGQLTTYFYGICAHIKDSEMTNWPHRCVLPNGIVARTINERSIASHVASIHFDISALLNTSNITLPPPDDQGIIHWQVAGAALNLENEEVALTYLESYGTCIPSLKTLTPDLGPLSPTVVDGRNPILASVYFNVAGGTFHGGMSPQNAAIAILESVTSDTDVVLNVSSFTWGSGSITLTSGSELYVTNNGAGIVTDSPWDFLLQYTICESIPPNAGVPGPGIGTCETVKPRWTGVFCDDVGPGCSNTNYP
jgi:hypothetical protein